MADDVYKFKVEPEAEPQVLNKLQTKLAESITKAMSGGLSEGAKQAAENVKKTLGDKLKDVLGKVGGAVGGSAKAYAQGQGASGANQALAAAGPQAAAVSAVFSAIGNFVSIANPGIMEQLNEAFMDIQGVIGQLLTPALEVFVPFVRQMGDVIATMLPSQQAMNNLFQQLKPLFDQLAQNFQTMAPVIHEVVELSIKLAAVLVDLAVTVQKVILKIMDTLNKLSLGVFKKATGINFDYKATSAGAAARGTQYSGAEEMGRSLAQASFGSGGSAAQRTAENTQKTAQILETVVNTLPHWARPPAPQNPGAS